MILVSGLRAFYEGGGEVKFPGTWRFRPNKIKNYRKTKIKLNITKLTAKAMLNASILR